MMLKISIVGAFMKFTDENIEKLFGKSDAENESPERLSTLDSLGRFIQLIDGL
jgi:hypothetical protein